MTMRLLKTFFSIFLNHFFFILFITLFLLSFSFFSFVFADGVAFEASNLEFRDGKLQARRSGCVLFHDRFESSDAWAIVDNYENKLDIEFGKEIDGVKSLYLTRTKSENLTEQYPKDTAWKIVAPRKKLDTESLGKEFVLYVESSASQSFIESSTDGYHSGIVWYDAEGRKISCSLTPISTGVLGKRQFFTGVIPSNADSYELQFGEDVPNIEIGSYLVLHSVTLEVLDDPDRYSISGSFISNIFKGGRVAWDAEIPNGACLLFQIATANHRADNVDSPGAFSSFHGPDGSSDTFFIEPFEVDAPFFRYKIYFIPNGKSTPVLRAVTIGDRVDCNWRNAVELEQPRIKLVGEYSKPSLLPDASIEFDIIDPIFIEHSSIKISIDDADVTANFSFKRISDDVLHCQGKLSTLLSQGLHCATVVVSDILGNSLTSKKTFLIGEAPTTPCVTLREDGVTLIDGVPFFPIGIYGVMEREFNGNNIDEAFRGLKEAGFNFAHSYSIPREDRFLAAAEKYGFKLWSVARLPDERMVEVERHSSAIIAWYLGDDTSANTSPAELYDYFDSCKAIDPTRLTVQADPIESKKTVSNYQPYVKGTDAFLPEIYPIHKEGEQSGWDCVAQTVADIKRSRSDAIEANDGPKAIWPIIQYFQGWGWKRFPTYAELRAMSFGAIAAGANGITWYTYGGLVLPEKNMFNYGVTTTPERWNNISQVANQINELSPVLLERTDKALQPRLSIIAGESKDSYGNDSIVYLLKRHENKTYLIVVNSTHEEIAYRLTHPSFRDMNKIETLYDEKMLASPRIENDSIGETIEGFGVRVYRLL